MIGVPLNICSKLRNAGNNYEQTIVFYLRYIQNIQVRCKRQLHIGNEKNGGYHVCEDPEVPPTPSCLVYSFGYVLFLA